MPLNQRGGWGSIAAVIQTLDVDAVGNVTVPPNVGLGISIAPGSPKRITKLRYAMQHIGANQVGVTDVPSGAFRVVVFRGQIPQDVSQLQQELTLLDGPGDQLFVSPVPGIAPVEILADVYVSKEGASNFGNVNVAPYGEVSWPDAGPSATASDYLSVIAVHQTDPAHPSGGSAGYQSFHYMYLEAWGTSLGVGGQTGNVGHPQSEPSLPRFGVGLPNG